MSDSVRRDSCTLLKSATSGYLELSEEQNALDYLEKAVGFIKSAELYTVDWKWAILATHAALYGFMICALKGTDPDNVCDGGKKRKLIDFLTAFKQCQDSTRKNISGFNQPITPSEEQKQAVERIHNEFRNEFVHFHPKLWFIEPAALRQIVVHALEVIRMISLEMGCYFIHYEPGDTNKITLLISEGQEALRKYRGTDVLKDS